MATRQITGTLNYKKVAGYIKKSGIGVSVARFGEKFLLANGFHLIKAPSCPELAHLQSFPAEWERATFQYGQVEQGGRDAVTMWNLFGGQEFKDSLTITNKLHETPDGSKGKSGTFFRLFQYSDNAVYIGKDICDMFSRDIGELEDFLFESQGQYRPIRVSDRSGHVAYLMPANIKL